MSCIKLMVDNRLDPNELTDTSRSALHAAIASGSAPLVEQLLRHNADVNLKETAQGVTPLHTAAYDGNRDLCSLLLSHGAQTEARDDRLFTPMHYACYMGHTAVINLLQERGARSDARAKVGQTPLHSCVFSGHVGALIALLRAQVDVNVRDNSGNSPLHIAVQNGHVKLVELLLDNGAVLHSINVSNGRSPLHELAESQADLAKKTEIFRLLQRRIESKDALYTLTGDTLLHLAARSPNSSPEFIIFLLRNSFDPFLVNFDGKTAMDVARESDRPQIYDLLINEIRQSHHLHRQQQQQGSATKPVEPRKPTLTGLASQEPSAAPAAPASYGFKSDKFAWPADVAADGNPGLDLLASISTTPSPSTPTSFYAKKPIVPYPISAQHQPQSSQQQQQQQHHQQQQQQQQQQKQSTAVPTQQVQSSLPSTEQQHRRPLAFFV
jgi:ankyrin repeat protein